MIRQSLKARPNERNISTQHLAKFLRAACYTRLATLQQHVARCCKMLDGVGSSLKMVHFLLQHFWMLQDVARVWLAPNLQQDVTLTCCVRLAGP